jgi:hypothetical protein
MGTNSLPRIVHCAQIVRIRDPVRQATQSTDEALSNIDGLVAGKLLRRSDTPGALTCW